MARLPVPGSDTGTWGDILNEYLNVEHNADGTLKSSGSLASKADDSSVVKLSGAQTVAGVKTFSSSPVVPTPTSGTDAANKTYVDTTASAGTPDADATTKGKIQLTGDLAGTAASPQIATGVIVNADINASAAIAKSKLANLDIVNADINAAAAIAKSKLANLDIVDADVNAAAAIAQSKIANLTANLAAKKNDSVATNKLLGRGTAGTGVIEEITLGTNLSLSGTTLNAASTDISNKQDLDSDLTAIAGLIPANDDVIQRKAGAWTNRTMAQVKTDLALVKGDVGLGNVDNTSDATKNSAVATLTNKTLTSPVINTPTGIVKGDVGLGNVNDTSDINKPVSTAQQAAIDAAKQGLDVKDSVKAATTAAGTLATSFENLDVIDGVTLATGDRILIKDQAAGAENGIYTVNASGAPTRAIDANISAEVTAGMYVFVSEGTANGNNGFVLTTDDPITLGTTALVFTQFSGAGQITAGAGLTKTGNTLDVGAGSGISVAADSVAIDTAVVASKTDNLSVFAATTSAQLAGVVSDETGSGALVFATSPTLVTPALGTPASGVATNLTGTAAGLTAGNVTTNANLTGPITSTGNATSVASQTGTGSTFVMNTSPTLVTPALGTPASGVATNLTGTAAGLTAGNVSTNANLTGPITSTGNATAVAAQTGTGSTFVMSTSPTLVTPTLGVATATSVNKITLTAPATGSTLTIPDGVTLTGPASSGTAMTLGNAEIVTGVKTFGSAGAVGRLQVAGTTSGTTILDATAVASGTLTLPAATDTLVGRATTDTLTNKRVTPRVSTEASSATPTINTDNADAHSITALAVAITSFTTNLSGTPTNFQKLTIRIKDNATARAITWGTSFEAKGAVLPTTTVISKVLTVGFIYDSVTSKWGCVATAQEA